MNPAADFNPGITVIHFAICPFVQRINTVLHSYDVPFDVYNIDIYAAKPQWLKTLLPAGKVPALCFKGEVLGYDFGELTTLTESTALLYLLNDLLDGALMPADMVQSAKHRHLFTIAEVLHEHVRVLLVSKKADEVATALDKISGQLTLLSHDLNGLVLENRPNVTMLEAIYAPLFNLMAILQKWQFDGLLSGNTEQNARLNAWQRHLIQLPAFNKALADNYEQELADFVNRAGGFLSAHSTALKTKQATTETV